MLSFRLKPPHFPRNCVAAACKTCLLYHMNARRLDTCRAALLRGKRCPLNRRESRNVLFSHLCASTGLEAAPSFQPAITKFTRPAPSHLVPEICLHLLPLENQGDIILPLWQELEEISNQVLGPPYWAVAWPGGQAVARYLLDNPNLVVSKRVLDIASGCGVGALAAAKAGASSVVAVDIDPLAAMAVDLNSQLNGLQGSVRSVVGNAKDLELGDYDLVMAGDVCFQKGVAEEILPKLQQHAAAGGLALLGDPTNMRPFSPQRLGGYTLEPLAQYTVKTNASSLLEGNGETLATVWRMCA